MTIESAKVTGNELTIDVAVASSTGHKLPTAYPSRRAWLHLRISDPSGRVLFESGAPEADGSIVGNDNDADALAFEPHYLTIDAPDQVQIYESIMVDQNGGVTTGLLRGVSYVKDNRILPRGFDKATASDDVAVRGGAKDDPDFVAGSDRIRYRITLAENTTSALSIDVALLYQSIGYRWAENLRAYDARETQRFVQVLRGNRGRVERFDCNGRIARDAAVSNHVRQRKHQCSTCCARRKPSASRPCSNASVASMPAAVHVGAATVTERGAPSTGQPVVGSRMWL